MVTMEGMSCKNTIKDSVFFNCNRDFDVKGSFNNYVDKMREEGVKKCLFLSTLRL